MPVTDETTVEIRLADFGSACWEEKRLSKVIQPELLRAPEVAFGLPWSFEADIWNAGIIVCSFPTQVPMDHLLISIGKIYKLLTAKHLFKGRNLKDHLRQMEILLGPIPPSFISSARFKEQCFSTDGM